MANNVEMEVVLRGGFGLDRAAVASDQEGDEERRQGVEVEGAVLAEVQRNDGGAVEGLEGFESVVDHSVKVLGVKEGGVDCVLLWGVGCSVAMGGGEDLSAWEQVNRSFVLMMQR